MLENTHSALLEPTGRVELPTSRLRIGCSTTELRRLSRKLQNFNPRRRSSENQLTGTFEENELPAFILAGAAGTLAIGPGILHVSDELVLVAETKRASIGRCHCAF